MIKRLTIRANKNCEACEAEMLVEDDINIDLLFEDWRECSNHCDECGKEERVYMCNIQFELINLIANSLTELRRRQNNLANMVLKRDKSGSKVLKKQEELMKKEEERSETIFS